MSRIAIGFLTKDRVELSKRTLEPLLQPDKFDLHWFDGSRTNEGKDFFRSMGKDTIWDYASVLGGPDAAVVFALTKMLGIGYDYIGLCENDVLLPPDWFGPTFALFERGKADGLNVGAVSARCYHDRILIQRDGYAVVHNLGWGMQIMTREAARLALRYMRTGFTTENAILFSQLSGLDIRKWWAFRGSEHMLCADWGNDRILAAHGLASLALTPSPVEMIGQDPPLSEQGLQLADGAFELLRDDKVFAHYRDGLKYVRSGLFKPPCHRFFQDAQGYVYFPHHIGTWGEFTGDWNLHWSQGFGPFAWRAGKYTAGLSIPVSGPCTIYMSGGEHGGLASVKDTQSGFTCGPTLKPEKDMGVLQIVVPGAVAYRDLEVTASPGSIFYGLRTQIEQPDVPYDFDWNGLPPV